jgi:hypothetical protein
VLPSAAIAGLVAIVLAVPLARPYAQAQSIKGDRGEAIVKFYSADVQDFFRPHARLATYYGHLLPDVHPERALFPGFSIPGAVGGGARASRSGRCGWRSLRECWSPAT